MPVIVWIMMVVVISSPLLAALLLWVLMRIAARHDREREDAAARVLNWHLDQISSPFPPDAA